MRWWPGARQRFDPGPGAVEQARRRWQSVVEASRPDDAALSTPDSSRTRLERAIEQTETSRAEARCELDAQSRARKEASARADQAELRADNLEQRLDAVHAERGIVDAELRRLRIDSASTVAQLATARQEIDELTTSLRAAQDRSERADSRALAAEAATAAQTARADESEHQVDRLQSELAAERSAHALTRAALDRSNATQPHESTPTETPGTDTTRDAPPTDPVLDRYTVIARTDARWASYSPPVLGALFSGAMLTALLLRYPTGDAAAVGLTALVVATLILTLMGTLPRHLFRLTAVPYRSATSRLPGWMSVVLLTAMLASTFEGGRRLSGLPPDHQWTWVGIVPVIQPDPVSRGPFSSPNIGVGLMLGTSLAAVLVLLAVGIVTVGVVVQRIREHRDPVASVVVPAVTALTLLSGRPPSEPEDKKAINDALSRLATNLETVFPRSISGTPEQEAIRDLGAGAAQAVRSWELRVINGDPEQLHELRHDLAHIVSVIGNGNYGDLPTAETDTPRAGRRPWLSGAARALPVLPPLALVAALQWSAPVETTVSTYLPGAQGLLESMAALWMLSGVGRLLDPGHRRQLFWLSRLLAKAFGPGSGTTASRSASGTPDTPACDVGATTRT